MPDQLKSITEPEKYTADSPRTLSISKSICSIVVQQSCFETPSGGRLNKKDGLTRYGNSHVKDKTS